VATDTRECILDASRRLFSAADMPGTGIKQILAEADAAFASLYHYSPAPAAAGSRHARTATS
jgi:AcrR family transcriptional regulator